MYGFRSSAGLFAAAGRYVAFVRADVDGRNESETDEIIAFDLRTGRRTLDPRHDAPLSFPASISTLSLDARGASAWQVDYGTFGGPVTESAIYVHDARGTRAVAGPTKGLSGLSIHGNDARWSDNGQPRSTTLG